MTEKQLAATRRNALKSTGPRSAKGRARSSRNSVKTVGGCYWNRPSWAR